MGEIRFLMLILVTGIVFSVPVALIAKYGRKPVYKYIPALVLLLAGVAFIIKARYYSEGMEGLGFVIFAMMAWGGCIITVITAAAIDLFKKYKIRKSTL